MKYFSMFSGIGGFEYGIERAFDFWQGRSNEQVGDLFDSADIERNGQN